MDTVEVVTLIKTMLTRRGNGTTEPIRVITQYWSMDGVLVFEVDPSPGPWPQIPLGHPLAVNVCRPPGVIPDPETPTHVAIGDVANGWSLSISPVGHISDTPYTTLMIIRREDNIGREWKSIRVRTDELIAALRHQGVL